MANRGGFTNQLSTIQQPKMGRSLRHPQHPFTLKQKPWVITPFFIAPVLAGETLKNLTWQARIYTDPIRNRLIGWWAEQMLFYVKLSDMDGFTDSGGNAAAIQNMLLNSGTDLTGVDSVGANANTYYYPGPTVTGKVDWVKECMRRVVDEYFRDEGEDYNTAGTYLTSSSANPMAKIAGEIGALHSLMPEADYQPSNIELTVGVDDKFSLEELDAMQLQYQWLQQGGAIDMDYEAYLRMFGVTPPATVRAKSHVPELVRFARNWAYPSNAINESTGAAASAMTWQISERADKDRLFLEPGFLFGVQVVRPKVYLAKQLGTITAEMNNVMAWLPAVLSEDPRTSMKLIPDVEGPLGDITDAGGYWLDIKDLFMYGEQFTNYDLNAAAGDNSVALPRPALSNVGKYYADETDIDALFVSGAADQVYTDGIVQAHIASRLRDTSS